MPRRRPPKRRISWSRLSDDKLAEFSACQRQFNSIQRSEPTYVDADGKEREPTDEEAEAYEAEQLKIRPRMIELMKEMIRIPSTSDAQAEKFFAAVGDDLPTYIVTMEKYSESTQLGEASASSSS